jgi:hypothetical protein
MDILSPLILLHENGYKAFTDTAGSKDLGLAMVDSQGKILCLAEVDIEDAGSAALVRLAPAVQSRVQDQSEAQQAIEVVGTSKGSLRKAAENAVAEVAKTFRGEVGASGEVRDGARRPEDSPILRHGNNHRNLEK